ncbi:hypothetical protein [Pseudonocardia alni]|uniref:hypothetical protein n=1 Tax=Pseudonocardia alni TaxID=33907 RepID=UPI00332B1FB9
MPPIPRTDAVAQQPDEDEHIRRRIDPLLRTTATTFDLHRHGYRATHATPTCPPRRRVSADDRLASRPWHGPAAHRPPGSVDRLRRRAHQELGAQRGDLTAVAVTGMRSASELPD